jgi:hypothetical protein
MLKFSIQSFKCHISAAAVALFSLNAHCGTMFSHLHCWNKVSNFHSYLVLLWIVVLGNDIHVSWL